MSEPTLAEVVVKLDHVAAQLTTLATRMDSDRLTAAQTFVVRETYNAEQRVIDVVTAGLNTRVTDLEKARDDDQKWRKQNSFTLAVAAVNSLVLIALTILTIVSR